VSIYRSFTIATVVVLGSCLGLFLDDTVAEDVDYSDALQPVPALAPEAALESFHVADGFRIELACAEPNVADPVAMAFDAVGRLFVIEMRGYSENQEDMAGRVRLLEDTNDDGTYDKSTVFADGLSWPTAIFCTQGGILVGAAPDIIWLKDEDGDGQADQQRVVFTGFRKSNVQGLLNTFQWGLDNRIHGVTSSSGGSVQKVVDGKPQGEPIALRGRDFSIDPLTMTIQAISGGGQHGMSMNSWADKFTCSNSDHLQQIIFPDHYLARNPYLSVPGVRRSIAEDGPQAEVFRASPVEAWRVIRTKLRVANAVPGPVEGGGRPAGYFTGATGVTIFRGDGWPEAYRGLAIIGDVGSNLIHRKKLTRQGVEYRGKRIDDGKEFVASSDIWFRPVQYANAPDGSLYVADMYREVIEHPKSLPPMIKKHLDLTSGKDRGRIYRIVGDGFQRRPVPRLSQLPSSELVALLDHPNAWHRETASRLIYERQDTSIAEKLVYNIAHATSPEGRVASLCTLAGMDQLTDDVLLYSLEDPHPRVRQHALRLSEPHLKRSPQLRDRLAKLSTDNDPHVRFQLALSAGEVPLEEKAAILADLAGRDGSNPDMQAAIQSSLKTGAGLTLQAIAKKEEPSRELLAALARQIGKQQRQEDLAVLLTILPSLHDNQPELFELLIQSLDAPPESRLAQQLAKATQGSSQEVIAKMVEEARHTASDLDVSVDKRVRAIEVLPFGEFRSAYFKELLQPFQPLPVQKAALATIQEFNSPEVAELIVSQWSSLGPDLRAQATEVLTSRASWVGVLLKAMKENQISPADIDVSQLAELKPILDAEQGQQIDAVLKKHDRSDRAGVVRAYQASLSMPGEKDRGKKVFAKHCAACHQFGGKGNPIGPNLAAMKNRGPDAILVNILQPNAEVNPQYMNYLCLTTDGRTFSGIIANETSTSITLVKDDGKSETILRIDIDQLRSTGVSLMPEGLENVISPEAMADLLCYLTETEAK